MPPSTALLTTHYLTINPLDVPNIDIETLQIFIRERPQLIARKTSTKLKPHAYSKTVVKSLPCDPPNPQNRIISKCKPE